MNKICIPNYDKSILNIMASIQKYYNVDTHYKGIASLDDILSKHVKNIVFIIFDGLGDSILTNHLSVHSFLNKYKIQVLTSLFPSSTVPCTSSYYSGLSPKEHGWLGWSLYFDIIKKYIDVYTGCESHTDIEIKDDYKSLIYYTPVMDCIKNVSTYFIAPIEAVKTSCMKSAVSVNNMTMMFNQITSLCKENYEKFIIAYWNLPDYSIHQYGCYSKCVSMLLRYINTQIEKMCVNIKNTILIISADHGLIDINQEVILNEMPEITECLLAPPCIEERAMSLFIKPDKMDIFENRFYNRMNDNYLLISRETALQNNYFGLGDIHKNALGSLGDYIACGIGNVCMKLGDKITGINAQHGGLTKDEMEVPLVVCSM